MKHFLKNKLHLSIKMKESAAGEIEKQYNKVIDMADKLFQDEKYEKLEFVQKSTVP